MKGIKSMKYSTLELRRKGVSDHLVNCYAEVCDKLIITSSLDETFILNVKKNKIEKAIHNLYGIGF